MRFLNVVNCAVLAAIALAATPATADVVVIANRAAHEVAFRVTGTAQSAAKEYRLAAGDLVPIPVEERASVSFDSGGAAVRYDLDANSVYFFFSPEGGSRLDLHGIGFATRRRPASKNAPPPAAANGDTEIADVAVVPVKVFVDDERTVDRHWRKWTRERIEAASDITEKHCRVRFKVVAADVWDSDDQIKDFELSLREFENETTPDPARVAIGFTSQYERREGRFREPLGGTRGPFRRHILVREWRQHVSQQELLEILVHELGHFLGAAHSPEQTSAMRPTVGDKQANAKIFRVGYDPVNTLALYLIGEQMRAKGISTFRDLSVETKMQLREIYTSLHRALPEDPAAEHFLRILDLPAGPVPQETARPPAGAR